MYVGDPNDLSPRDIYISNTTKERTYKFGFRYVLALDLSHATTPEVTPYNSHPNGTPAFTILDLVWILAVFLCDVWCIVIQNDIMHYWNPTRTLAN